MRSRAMRLAKRPPCSVSATTIARVGGRGRVASARSRRARRRHALEDGMVAPDLEAVPADVGQASARPAMAHDVARRAGRASRRSSSSERSNSSWSPRQMPTYQAPGAHALDDRHPTRPCARSRSIAGRAGADAGHDDRRPRRRGRPGRVASAALAPSSAQRVADAHEVARAVVDDRDAADRPRRSCAARCLRGSPSWMRRRRGADRAPRPRAASARAP